MAERGVYFDPNIGLVLQNYIENKPKFLGIGNYNEEGFAFMEKAVPTNYPMFKRALAAKVKMPMGTDAVAGAHGQNAREIITRVQGRRAEPDGRDRRRDVAGGGVDGPRPSRSARSRRACRPTSSPSTAIRCRTSPRCAASSFVMKGGKVYKR